MIVEPLDLVLMTPDQGIPSNCPRPQLPACASDGVMGSGPSCWPAEGPWNLEDGRRDLLLWRGHLVFSLARDRLPLVGRAAIVPRVARRLLGVLAPFRQHLRGGRLGEGLWCAPFWPAH